jgi:SAM-dependent methyltransferase
MTTPQEPLPQHVAANREAWDRWAADFVGPGEREWARLPGEETWGIFGIPEPQVGMLPDDLEGLDTIELGCGTGYVSAWLARRGARPVGIDNSPRQLETAARLQREHGIAFPLLLGNAERVPYPDASFDFAISEYGAVLWADPDAWVPEAARLLRPGGRLHVLTNSQLVYLTTPDIPDAPAGERLERPAFDTRRITWDGDDSAVEFHPTHGDWIRIFRAAGFEILELVEPQVPEDASSAWGLASHEWARQWPVEEIWKVRKRD